VFGAIFGVEAKPLGHFQIGIADNRAKDRHVMRSRWKDVY
jgi:hypothetical protein